MASTCINEKSEEGNSKTFSEGGQGISSSSELDEAGFFTTAPNTSSLADTSALERFSAAVASAAASVSNTFNGSSRPGDDDQQQQHQATTEEANRTDNVDGSPSVSVVNTAEDMSSSSKNMLRVPTSGYGGAIPRRPFSRDSSAESNSSAVVVAEEVTNITKTCFCGHYTEAPTASKRGRCKFCRSRAKYVAGQRSFDASRLFGRRRERGEPRRAASEDQRSGKRGGGGVTNPNEDQEKASDEQKSMETTVSTSSLDTDLRTKETSTSRKTWRLRPSVRRQARLELDVPAASASSAQASSQSSSSNLSHANTDTSPLRDHGLRTPPGPPVPPLSSTTTSARSRPTDFNLTPSFILESSSQRYATHVMASDMSSLLAPPSRSGALARAHTDPTSSSNYEHVTSASSQRTPNSPPPTYEEVMKQVLNFEDSGGSSGPSKTTSSVDQCCWWSKQPQYQPQAPRVAPPSYEEALSSRVVTSLRLGQGNVRSLSEDRVTSHPSPPPPFRARNSSSGNLRPLTRSSRVEEIPDIYWEQAARELDFCTCRKCQARYRQYFEEDLVDPNSDSEAMIPMETQFLMQEVLTDGMAFCSLM